jgi:hypothetical protein
MAKTLNQFIEGYLKVKNPDEQKFVDKHVVAKHADRNGNGDEVFKGSKVKMDDRRKTRHGYNPGEDEKVYEDTGLTESTYKFDVSGEHGKAGVDKLVKHAQSKGIKAKVHTYDGPGGGNPVIHLTHKDPKALHSYVNTHMYPVHDISRHKINEALKGNQHKLDHNKNGKVDAHDFHLLRKKKKVAEETEELEELSKKTLGSYVIKSLAPSSEKSVSNLASKGGYKLGKARDDDYTAGEKEDVKSVKRSLGVLTAVRKMTKEQSELEEKLDMKKASMGTVVKDFQKSDAPQFQGKSQKKRQAMAIAAKLTAERGGKPLRKEEKLADLLGDLTETHRRTMLSVFDKLNEDNQKKFLEACETPEGVESMLDFSISHRGE